MDCMLVCKNAILFALGANESSKTKEKLNPKLDVLFVKEMILNLSDRNIVSLTFEKEKLLVRYLDDSTKEIKLPKGLNELYCSFNQLTTLEGLPKGLKKLNCSFNRFVSLDGLPEGLKVLDCAGNELTTLENLPETLEILDCSDNCLSRLEDLPKGLEKLDCSGNQLTTLENLPEGLKELYCYDILSLMYIEPTPTDLICNTSSHLEVYKHYRAVRDMYVSFTTFKRKILAALAKSEISLVFLEILDSKLDDHFKKILLCPTARLVC